MKARIQHCVELERQILELAGEIWRAVRRQRKADQRLTVRDWRFIILMALLTSIRMSSMLAALRAADKIESWYLADDFIDDSISKCALRYEEWRMLVGWITGKKHPAMPEEFRKRRTWRALTQIKESCSVSAHILAKGASRPRRRANMPPRF